MDLYIYYRVPARHAAELVRLATAMQAGLARATGVVPAFKRRPEASHGLHTYMEVYPDVGAGFSDALEHAVEAAGLARFIEGGRHVEIFQDAAPCA